MREIKFRAWDKTHKRFIDKHSFAINFNPVDDKQFHGTIIKLGYHEDLYELMQYTGLKDKNGKEIFEGDIVEAEITKEKKAITKVWYFAPTWMLADYTTGKLCGSYEMSDFGRGENLEDIEIIGNIYENPELVERKL